MERKRILFVISAPSGSGKTTLCKRLVEEMPDLVETISTTTRPPRPGEKDGQDYIFVSEEQFEDLRQKNAFAEWASVFGHRYGTLKSQIEDILEQGKDALLSIDVHGAQQIRAVFADSILIFVMPPSLEELARRLQGRSTETEAEIERRLGIAKEEIAHTSDYDYVVVNDTIEEAVRQLISIIVIARSKP